MKYKIYVTDRVLIESEPGILDWKKDSGKQECLAGSFNTLKECFEDMEEWGSRWVLYPSVYIMTDEDGEIWESTPELYKCECCNHEEWDTMEAFALPEYKKLAMGGI